MASVANALAVRGKSEPPSLMILPSILPPKKLVTASAIPAIVPACSAVIADK